MYNSNEKNDSLFHYILVSLVKFITDAVLVNMFVYGYVCMRSYNEISAILSELI